MPGPTNVLRILEVEEVLEVVDDAGGGITIRAGWEWGRALAHVAGTALAADDRPADSRR